MYAVKQEVLTMTVLAGIFEAIAIMSLVEFGHSPNISDLPPACRDLVLEEDDVAQLFFSTRKRVENAARYDIEHIDDWTVKTTLTGFDL